MGSHKVKNFFLILLCILAALSATACAELNEPKNTPFYGNTAPPPAGEFRWSNGELPKTLDPALAVSPSEAQAVRAVYEGLTEWDAKTLHPVPAVADKWEASEDNRIWTFYLRQNAVWSNGKRVTAQDFARSWKRLAELGEKSPHSRLLANIIGSQQVEKTQLEAENQAKEAKPPIVAEPENTTQTEENQGLIVQYPEMWFGVDAVGDSVLRVWLVEPDVDFPKLVAHPALRPVYEGSDFNNAAKIITNGAFRLTSFDKNGVALEKSKNYWNAEKVKLERVRFVPARNEEAALAAYQAGEVDAVTNANFQPLALKLLSSYKDFQRTIYNAVTFYEFNRERKHFQDRRVREALTIAVDRERLTNDEMDGATVPANKFLPYSARNAFTLDVQRARNLLSEAGFPNGKDFPKIKLLINRNETQRRIAKAVSAQWRKNLGIESDVIVSSLDELDNAIAAKDFDLVRRVVVLPTTDESANLQAMFPRKEEADSAEKQPAPTPLPTPAPQIGYPIALPTPNLIEEDDAPPPTSPKPNNSESTSQENTALESTQTETTEFAPILTESQAIEELPAIPLYFPLSYALVKPYVIGFEPNLLDAPALTDVEIQANWRPQETPNP